MRPFAQLLVVLLTLFFVVPQALAEAGETSESESDEPSAGTSESESEDEPRAATSESEADAPVPAPLVAPLAAVDDLGRPFPDPRLLNRARGWTVGGIAMSAVGGGLVVGGLFLGSSIARGELQLGSSQRTGALLGSTFGVGAVLLAAGIPTLSAGTFTTAQLNRTIKGAEKVPRTVANEGRYWNAGLERQFGQALTVSGGGTVLMGVVSTAAVVALVGTEVYKPGYWGIVAGTYGGGALMIVAGMLLQKDADATMEAISLEVDPYRQQSSLPPRLRVARLDPRVLLPMPAGPGVRWAFRF